MKRALVTGATGFIGRHCLPLLLKAGYEVHAVASRAPTQDAGGERWYQRDLLDAVQVSELLADVQPTHLLHLAWYAVPGKFWTSTQNLHWVQASLRLFEAFASAGGHRLVAAGTCAEYDWRWGYCSEDVTPLRPATLYGASKHGVQVMLETFSRQAGLSSAWGRLFFLYGPYEHPQRLVASVIRSLLQGEPALCSHGKQIRDFLHVEDVASAFVSLLDCDVAGPLNIASGEPIVLADIVRRIAMKLSREDLVRMSALAAAPGEAPMLVADSSRLRNEVAWLPHYNLESGLDQTIDWWRGQMIGVVEEVKS
jgi:nucleoside-diphosphate-sugar epimerase